MASKTRVAVAISGGVDSSLSAALLRDAGYEVVGVTMRLWHAERHGLPPSRPTCGSVQDVDDARRVCQVLDIPFHVVDFGPQFRTCVVDYFCSEYACGRTPNPCIACNRHIKFRLLLDHVLSMGAEYLATGHYAGIESSGGEYRLLKGSDPLSDQSYFLYTLGQSELRHLLFPVGGYLKSEVRRMASERGLPVADKPKSQDLCFVPDGKRQDFLRGFVSPVPGQVVDADGNVLGEHRGIAFYTIGQRTGLGVARGRRLYVLSIDAGSDKLVVGPEDGLFVARLIAGGVSYVCDRPQEPLDVKAKIRYRSPDTDAVLYPCEDRVEVRFSQPQRAAAPGQAVVFYQGDRVLGGGIIEAS